MSLSASPDSPSQFAEVLAEESDWYTLGTFLGVPTHELHAIETNYRLVGIQRCLIEIYKWMDKNEEVPTWRSIAEDSRRMGNKALASKIEYKLANSSGSLLAATICPATTKGKNQLLSASIKFHSDDICKVLVVNKIALGSLATSFYAKEVIDQENRISITTEKTGIDGANCLLDQVRNYLDGNDDTSRFDTVMTCFGKNEALKDVLVKIKERLLKAGLKLHEESDIREVQKGVELLEESTVSAESIIAAHEAKTEEKANRRNMEMEEN